MSYSFVVSSPFAKEAKRLGKKYPSFKADLLKLQESLLNNPLQGVELTPGVRKIRMAIKSKNRGTSGGARVITFTVLAKEADGVIGLLLVYDKEDTSSVKMNVIKDIIRNLGLEP